MEITVEKLAKEIEDLKQRLDLLESIIVTKDDVEAIVDFLERKKKGELELLSIDDAMKELGIDEAEIREEISKET